DPTSLGDMKWAGIGAAWYWTVRRPNINTLCDSGDINGVTYAINGGYNGLSVRTAYWNQALAQGNDLLVLVNGPREDENIMSALSPDEQRAMYNEVMKRGLSRSFLATDGNPIETQLGFIYNIDGNVWNLMLTVGYLVDHPLAVSQVEAVANGNF